MDEAQEKNPRNIIPRAPFYANLIGFRSVQVMRLNAIPHRPCNHHQVKRK